MRSATACRSHWRMKSTARRLTPATKSLARLSVNKVSAAALKCPWLRCTLASSMPTSSRTGSSRCNARSNSSACTGSSAWNSAWALASRPSLVAEEMACMGVHRGSARRRLQLERQGIARRVANPIRRPPHVRDVAVEYREAARPWRHRGHRIQLGVVEQGLAAPLRVPLGRDVPQGGQPLFTRAPGVGMDEQHLAKCCMVAVAPVDAIAGAILEIPQRIEGRLVHRELRGRLQRYAHFPMPELGGLGAGNLVLDEV